MMYDFIVSVYNSKIFLFTAVIFALYLYIKHVKYNYWNSKNVPHDKPILLVGNILPLITKKDSIGNVIKASYDKFKEHKFHGMYMLMKPSLIVTDPELIRMILIKDFNKFADRGLYNNEKVDPLSGNLFQIGGERWKILRAKMSPTFTSGKLKQMFPLLKETGEILVRNTYKMVQQNKIIDTKDLLARYTIDTISSIAFGISYNSFENPDHDFKKYAKIAFEGNQLKNIFAMFAPTILNIIKEPAQDRSVTRFFMNTFNEMVDHRHEKNITRNDFLNLLMQLMDDGKLKDDDDNKEQEINPADKLSKLTRAEACAQAFVFFLAGYETSSSTATYCLYELALNPEIQKKVQKEVDEVVNSSTGVTYDKVLNEMEYLHKVFSETLRKHPSVPILNRECNEDYILPNTNLKIEKGTAIMISVTGLQRDPNIYPDPDKFDPERFSKENIAKRSPYVYFPFGDGPRNCIGARFGIVQTKIALISLLSKFDFTVCDKTPIPINYSKKSFVQLPEQKVYLKLEKRSL